MLSREAACIVLAFHHKTTMAKVVQIVHCFTKHLGLIQRVATHTAQKHFKDTEAESKDFIAMIKARLQGRKKDGILNIDQTPMAYAFHTVLETVGTKTIQVCASTTDTKHVTAAATVTASGKMLTLL
jgi:hypothetical protein